MPPDNTFLEKFMAVRAVIVVTLTGVVPTRLLPDNDTFLVTRYNSARPSVTGSQLGLPSPLPHPNLQNEALGLKEQVLTPQHHRGT